MQIDELITFLGTRDLEKTSNFYQTILGFELYKDQGACKIFNITKTAKLGFCSHMPVVLKEKSPILTLVSKNVNTLYKKIKKAGIYIPNPPKMNSTFKIYHFFFEDPNGYTIEIQKFLE